MPPEKFSKGGYLGPTPKDNDERVTRWRRRVAELLQRLGPAINLVAAEGELTAFYPLFLSTFGPDGSPSIHNYTGQGVYFGGTGLTEVEAGGLLFGNENTDSAPGSFSASLSVLSPGSNGSILALDTVTDEDNPSPYWVDAGENNGWYKIPHFDPHTGQLGFSEIDTDTSLEISPLNFDPAIGYYFDLQADKGKLMVGNGTAPNGTWGELPVGSNNQCLIADSAQTDGMKWGTLQLTGGGTGATTASGARTNLGLGDLAVLDDLSSFIGSDVQAWDDDLDDLAALTPTKGNLIVGNGTDWVSVGVGTDGQVLEADSGETAGVAWATPSGGGGTEFEDDVFRILDDGDNTKEAAFQASGITTGTTRTFAFPDASGTLELEGHTHTLSDITDAGALAALDDLSTFDTDDLSEGVTNLYYTDGRADARIAAAVGVSVQAYDVELAALAGLVSAADKLPYFTGSGTASLADLTTFGRSLIDDADASAARTTLGLVIGTDVQAQDAELAALAGLTSAADRLPYFTGSGTASLATFTSFGRSLVDDADAATARTTLGLSIGSDVQAYDADLAAIAALSPTKGNLMVGNGSAWVALGVGTDDHVLTADAAEASGVKWAASPSGVTDHGALTGLSDDDHTQYHNDARALTWMGTRSTSDLAEGSNLYYTDARADARIAAAVGVSVQAYDAELAALAGLTSAADKLPYFTGSGTAALATFTSFGRSLVDDADASAARTTLGVAIGSDVQAYDAELAALAGLTSAANKLPYFTGIGTASLADLSAFGRSLIDDADASAARTTLGLVIGTDVQAYDAELAAIAGLTSAADRLPYFTGSGTASLATFTSAARSLLDDASVSAMRTTLGLAIGSDVQAYDADLAAIAGLSAVNGDILYYNSGWQRLAKGTDDQVLTLASGLPSWADASGGGSIDGSGTANYMAKWSDSDTLAASLMYEDAAQHQHYWGSGAGNAGTSTGDYGVALGYQSLYALTSGTYNIGIGYRAGYSLATGTDNCLIGRTAGYAVTGSYNVCLGYGSGQGLSSGGTCVFIGHRPAGGGPVTGSENIGIGYLAAYSMTSGGSNTIIGSYAGFDFTTPTSTIAIGTSAGRGRTQSTYNIFIGANAGYKSDTSASSYNIFVGYDTGRGLTTGTYNSVFGYGAGYSISTGTHNDCFGYQAGNGITTGSTNLALGHRALGGGPVTGAYNIGLGYQPVYSTTSGSHNFGAVYRAGFTNTTGDYNISLGYQAGYSNSTGSRNICIGYRAGYSNTASDMLYIDNSNSATPLILGDMANNWVKIHNNLILPSPTVPGSAGATGTAGTISWDADYIYVCTATDTWKRAPLSTW